MEKLRIGIGVSSIGRFLPLIGKAEGLFSKANIDVEVVNQQDEDKIVEDLVKQKTPVGTPNAPSLLFSLLRGNRLVIVGGVLNRPTFYLVANEAVRDVIDLRGKRVGINQPRRMAGLVMLALLRKWGLDRERDLALVDLGINDKSLEGLRDKTIDAALLPPEKAFLAESEGFRLVADSQDLDCHWVPLATTREYLDAHRELVAKVATVYVESINRFKSQPQTTLKEIGRWLPALENKPQVLEKCYRLFAHHFEPTLAVSFNSVESILREVAQQDSRAKNIKPESIIEPLI